MDIHTNIPLKNFTTMKLGGNARFLAEIRQQSEIPLIYKNAKENNLPIFVLGGGSNIIIRDEGFNGIVLRMRISGFEVLSQDSSSATVRIGAGELWDSVVKRSVDMRLSGIEAMSAIPGTAGAGPIQNVGAYGQEIADTLEYVEAYDTKTSTFVKLTKDQCKFSYRDSIFKNSEKDRYIITYIILKLSKNLPQPPFYDSLQKYFDDNNISIFTQEIIRNSVIQIRKDKLPDPKILPNSGSFFKNTLIEEWRLNDLKKIAPNIPVYDMGDKKYKIPSGWLIENAGLKGQLINGIRIYDKNALVLVNESAKSVNDLHIARNTIINQVREKFRIELEQEPIEI